MLSAARLERLLDDIGQLPRPVLTIWTLTDVTDGATPGEAARVRVRTVLAKLRPELGDAVDELERQLLSALGRPAGSGTTMLFAGPALSESPDIIAYNLPIRLPIGSTSLGAEARLGEPWLAPLRLAISDSERAGVIYAHEQGVALYEVFLGEIEELLTTSPPPMPGEDDRLQRSKTIHPAHIADRGSSGWDDAQAHRAAFQESFYDDALREIAPVLAAREIETLLLIGTPSSRRHFEQVMSAPLREQLIGTGPGLSQQDASPEQVLEAVAEQLADHRRKAKAELMKSVIEHGVLGLSSCLSSLQRGQLERLYLPWDLDAEVFVETGSGYVGATPGQALALSSAAEPDVRPASAREQLIALADAHGTAVEFTHTGATHSPFDEVQGIAGLLRWSEAV